MNHSMLRGTFGNEFTSGDVELRHLRRITKLKHHTYSLACTEICVPKIRTAIKAQSLEDDEKG